MAKVEHTSDARVLVGIDISKHRHEVLIAAPGESWRRLTIPNSTDNFMRLIAILREFGMPVRIGFEATGNYHRVLMYHLGIAGFVLKLVSSIVDRPRPHTRSPPQQLGQERPKGCEGHLAHVADRRGADLPGPDGHRSRAKG